MANQAAYPVRTLCRVLNVSASGFYAWRDRPPSARAMNNAVLTEHIRQIHAESDQTYGMPRVRAELRDQGVTAGRQRVARLMRKAGLQGVSRRRAYIVTTRRDARQRPAPDLVQRRFHADSPNALWVADMTYVPTWSGFIYLAVVIDAWSRRVVGWSMGEQMSADLVLAALNMALQQRRPEQVIHHSDQGSQYTTAWPSAIAAARWACDLLWEQSAMHTTMPWRRASLPAWSVNSLTAKPSKPVRKPASQYLPGSRAGITPDGVIARWDTYHLLTSKGDRQRLFLNLMSHVTSPSTPQ